MKILVSLLIILLLSPVISYAQNNKKTDDKILEINKRIRVFFRLTEIDFSNELEKREGEIFEDLKASISKETIDAQIIKHFNKNFSPKEIDELYEYYTNPKNRQQSSLLFNEKTNKVKTTISPELDMKRDSVLKELIHVGNKAFDEFKNQLYVLDSINFEKNKDSKNHDEILSKRTVNRINGIYETLEYEQNNQNHEEFINSIKLKKTPSIEFNALEQIKIRPQEDGSLCYSIDIILNKEGSKAFNTLSANNIDKPLVIVVNNEIVTAPFVRVAIEDGKAEIYGNMTYYEAKRIVDNILR